MIQSIVAGVLAGGIDPVELTEQALARAEEAAGLNAIVHLDPEGARQAAAGVRGGALAGIPLLVKEIIAVRGMPFQCGSRVFAGRVAGADADVVRRARAEGAVIIGLTHSHEFAYGCTGTSNVTGPCRNPHDPTRMTGGSSSGSAAAVAAGVVPLALGTDTAGSVRIPAALCGVVGALPERGTLSADGVFPLSTSLDRVGVLTASVADARYAVAAVSGWDLAREPVAAPRVGTVADPALLDCAPEVADAYSAALDRFAEAGATIVEVQPPNWAHLTEIAFDLQCAEAAARHMDLAASIDDYQPDVRERLRVAAEVPGWRYVRARQRTDGVIADLGSILSTVDAMVLPTVPILAPPLDAVYAEVSNGLAPVRDLLLRNNRPLNITGYPALSVPIPSAAPAGGGREQTAGGGREQTLPVGLQLIATGNRKAFDVAEWVERTVRSAGSR